MSKTPEIQLPASDDFFKADTAPTAPPSDEGWLLAKMDGGSCEVSPEDESFKDPGVKWMVYTGDDRYGNLHWTEFPVKIVHELETLYNSPDANADKFFLYAFRHANGNGNHIDLACALNRFPFG